MMKKYITRFLLLTSLVMALAACGGGESAQEDEGGVAIGGDQAATTEKKVPEFEFTTQDNETLSNEDLEGTWWIADFIFTNCETVCIPMTNNMVKLQEKVNEENIDNVEFVSFSVDPDYDTPEVLTEYAEDYGADLSNWNFLTGYDFETIEDISMNGFKNMLAAPPEGDNQVVHGAYFFLVNPEGEILSPYSGMESEQMDAIVEDLKKMQ